MRRVFVIGFCFFSGSVYCQDALAPYSEYGLGEHRPRYNVQNLAMGGTGVSQTTPLQISALNPALLTYNFYSTFAGGVPLQKAGDDPRDRVQLRKRVGLLMVEVFQESSKFLC
ncbi:MAG: hypothetical protein HC842_06525 [Cytophagales bacterium]|nr:hypothetical protein [Cytophagales bacterium]